MEKREKKGAELAWHGRKRTSAIPKKPLCPDPGPRRTLTPTTVILESDFNISISRRTVVSTAVTDLASPYR